MKQKQQDAEELAEMLGGAVARMQRARRGLVGLCLVALVIIVGFVIIRFIHGF